jgi:hypothetical protein
LNFAGETDERQGAVAAIFDIDGHEELGWGGSDGGGGADGEQHLTA